MPWTSRSSDGVCWLRLYLPPGRASVQSRLLSFCFPSDGVAEEFLCRVVPGGSEVELEDFAEAEVREEAVHGTEYREARVLHSAIGTEDIKTSRLFCPWNPSR